MWACTTVCIISMIMTLHEFRPSFFSILTLTIWGLPEKFFLAWVGTYISKFGGDPKRVTL